MKKNKKIFIGICLFSVVEDGTLKYYILDERLEKVSDYNFHDFSYSDDRKSIISFISEKDFKGLAELELSTPCKMSK